MGDSVLIGGTEIYWKIMPAKIAVILKANVYLISNRKGFVFAFIKFFFINVQKIKTNNKKMNPASA